MGPYQCFANYKGHFYQWKWVWNGKYKCPGLSTVESISENWKSRDGAVEHAMEEYFKKVHLTKEQLEQIKKL